MRFLGRVAMFMLGLLCIVPPSQAALPAHLPFPPALPAPAASGLVAVDGVRIWYASWGRGKPVLLLEGGEDSTADWGYLVPDLVRHGYRAIAIDTRCQGRSTCSPETIGYHRFAEDDVAVMDRLGIAKAAVVGFSDGAITGIDLALHHPDRVAGVFAMGANSSVAGEIFTPSPDPLLRAHADQADIWCRGQYARQSPTPGNWPQLKQRTERLWATQPDFTQAQLRAIHVPVWIADGDRDQYITRRDTDMMAQTIPGAAELIVPEADHYALWEHPRLFSDAVLAFLRGG